MNYNDILNAAEYIKSKTKYRPKIALILGSGLGDYGDTLPGAEYIDYKDIPNFPVSTVDGHKGRFAINKDVLCMQGRFHFYEGYSLQEVTFPIRVMKVLGIESLIITNAAGGVNLSFDGGTLMMINDHINFLGTNPLIGRNIDEMGVRFPDMTHCYNEEYRNIAKECAKELGIDLKEGVYMAFTGPSYETPAEIRMARVMGADAVGMSTVPEAIVANHCGIKIIGISCITNMAAGVTGKALSHEEVTETAAKVKGQFTALVEKIVEKLL